MPRDHYEVLGVPRDADDKTLKRAYRQLALQYHPDRSKEADAADRFKEVSEAYAVLSDPEKRQVYDAYGHAGLEGRFGGAEQWVNQADFASIFRDLGLDFGSIFSQVFGGGYGGPAQRRARRGEDLVARLNVSARDVVEGIRSELRVERLEPCERCGGSGSADRKGRVRCATCGGQGQVARQQRTPFGMFTQVGTCPSCGGQGTTIQDPCRACSGRAVARARKMLVVQVPPGVEDGMRLRLAGQGHAHPDGPRGDAYVLISVDMPAHLERRGTNVLSVLRLPAPALVLGAVGRLEGIDGPVEIEVPTGSQPGDVVRNRAMGFPRLGGGSRGDLFVELAVELPRRPSAEEREHWEALFEFGGEEARKGVFSKLGDKVREKLR